jgi:hypothetical protein
VLESWNGGRSWRDDKTAAPGFISSLLYHQIRKRPLEDRMQLQWNANINAQSLYFLNFIDVEEDHHALHFRIERWPLPVKNRHHHQARLLFDTGVIELHPFPDLDPCS